MWLSADGTRIAQVVGNLLGNAAKFTPRGGRVDLSLEQEGADAVLRVRDSGVGITNEMLDRLFQPFMQADRTLDRASGGLGLGLALVKGLAELHGGTVTATSDGPGRGAEFVVRLPLSAAAEKGVANGETVRVTPRRVLIVEDNVDAAGSLKEALELDGHEVEVAYTGPEALTKARPFQPDVVLCDIGLPGMDGYEVARAFRADDTLDGAFLVALTGYALPEDLQRAKDAGFERHLAKPPTFEKLTEVLEEAGRGGRGRPLRVIRLEG
jgi:two-component system CheB/CheR fusion protein